MGLNTRLSQQQAALSVEESSSCPYISCVEAGLGEMSLIQRSHMNFLNPNSPRALPLAQK